MLSSRVRTAIDLPVRSDGDFVLYWMTAFRRVRSNFALQRARDLARELRKPLVILETLRLHDKWNSDRFHRFVIEGMVDNQRAAKNLPVLYYPYVEPKDGNGTGLVATLAKQACLVVSDDYPCIIQPHLVKATSKSFPTRLELVDSNGLVPISLADRVFPFAYTYRRFMQKTLPSILDQAPERKPISPNLRRHIPVLEQLPISITRRWPAAELDALLATEGLKHLAIDHAVKPCAAVGGTIAAHRRLRAFLTQRLANYDVDRNTPDTDGSSSLSPYLHFGHISAHDIFWDLMESEQWHPGKLGHVNGSKTGFWNISVSGEGFLDQLVTWREVGFNMCSREPSYDRFESLPAWAIETLEEHAQDPRPYIYSLDEWESARTHDPVWNAAQRQLVREGRIHNYLRMLWGKKILHWTESPREALDVMIHLNNKYALDGRDPNSYSGIFWVLGRYDRPWGPERPIFGKIRYMTSDNTAKKVALKEYLQRYSSQPTLSG